MPIKSKRKLLLSAIEDACLQYDKQKSIELHSEKLNLEKEETESCKRDNELDQMILMRKDFEQMAKDYDRQPPNDLVLWVLYSPVHNILLFFCGCFLINDRFFRDLKEMSEAKIIETFSQYETIFRDIFHDKSCIPDYAIKPHFEFDYLLISDLVTVKQQHRMYNENRIKLTDTDESSITTGVMIVININIWEYFLKVMFFF